MLTILAWASSLLALQVGAATLTCVASARSNLNIPLGCSEFELQSDGNEPSGLLIDYGENIEGRPTFVLKPIAGNPSRLVVTYSESKAGLDLPNVGLHL